MVNYIQYFVNSTLKYDCINKFNYKNKKNMPKLKKIVLSLSDKKSEINQIFINLLTLEIIANKKSKISKAHKPNIKLKIRKGDISGCTVVLRKKHIFEFLHQLLSNVFPSIKLLEKTRVTKKIKKTTFSFELKETLSFKELKKHYSIFKNLPGFNVTFVLKSYNKNNSMFIRKTLQIP